MFMNGHAVRSARFLALAVLLAALAGFAADTNIRPGVKAPDFTLPDTRGNEHTLSDYLDGETIVVLEWFNPECKFDIAHYHPIRRTMQSLHAKYASKNVIWLAINSGSEASGTATPELSEKRREEWGMDYPVLLDTSGEVGRMYTAKTTPQMFVIDRAGMIAYMGAIDDQPYVLNTKEDAETNFVEDAVDALLEGHSVPVSQTRAYGCKIKY